MAEIVKGDVEGLKKWIIEFLKGGDFPYVMAAAYEDYEYVDDVVYRILTDFDDYDTGFIDNIYFDTATTDLNDRFLTTQVSFNTFNKVENVLGKSGSILFKKYETPDAYWHNELRFFEKEKDLIKYRDTMIKIEIVGIDNMIEELTKLKPNIIAQLK